MGTVIDVLYWILVALIFARFILSWVNIGSYEIRDFVFRVTDPLINPVRRILPPMGGLDFSPIIVLFIAYIVRILLHNVVASL